jgi:hypothetical protein
VEDTEGNEEEEDKHIPKSTWFPIRLICCHMLSSTDMFHCTAGSFQAGTKAFIPLQNVNSTKPLFDNIYVHIHDMAPSERMMRI